jgi:hypothetical protein
MAALGREFALTCPVCNAPVVLPVTQSGTGLTRATFSIDLGALRRHIAAEHPQGASVSAITDRFHDLVTQLEGEGHTLADEARALLSRYEKEAAAVTDGLKPVLNELRTGITADVKDAIGKVETAVAEVAALLKQQTGG